MLEPCEVCVGVSRTTPNAATIFVDGELICAPVFQGEGRVCNDTIELLQLAILLVVGGTEGIALGDLEVLCTMQEQVHSGNGRGGKVLLLAINPAIGQLIALHIPDCFNQHTTGTCGGVIYCLTGLGCKQHDQQFDNGTRGIEFTGILLGEVGELLNQEFVSIAHDIGGVITVTDLQLGHMLYKVF